MIIVYMSVFFSNLKMCTYFKRRFLLLITRNSVYIATNRKAVYMGLKFGALLKDGNIH